MKQFIVISLLLLLSCQAGRGQSLNRLFDDFARQEHVTRVKLGPMLMTLSSLFTETMGVRSIEALEFDECDSVVKKNLYEAIRNLKDPDFETMVTSNEEGSCTKIMVRIEKELIREVVILTADEEKHGALVRIKGKIKPSDIERVINDQKDDRY